MPATSARLVQLVHQSKYWNASEKLRSQRPGRSGGTGGCRTGRRRPASRGGPGGGVGVVRGDSTTIRAPSGSAHSPCPAKWASGASTASGLALPSLYVSTRSPRPYRDPGRASLQTAPSQPGDDGTPLGSGYTELEDLVLTENGMTAFVTERGGNILKVDLQHADRSSAIVVTSGLIAPHQLVLFEAENIAWVIENDTLGRLVEIDLVTGTQKVLASGFEHAVGLVARSDRTLVLVSEQAASGGRISAIQLPGGTRTVVADGLTNPFFLHWLNAGESAVFFTERDPANRVSILEIQDPNHERRLALLGASFRPSSVLLVGNEMVVCADSTLVAYGVTGGYPAQVFINVPHEGLYIGSYRHVPVKVGSKRCCL